MKREEIISLVQEILIHRFPGNPEKQKIEEGHEKLVFSCPFCGDSEIKSSKKRGNLWFDSKSYKCFNGGCLTWMPLDRFFLTFSRKYHIHLPESSLTSTKKASAIKVKSYNPLLRFMTTNLNLVKIDDIAKRFGLIHKDDVAVGTNAHSFLKKRGLINIKAPIYFTQADDSALIFNLDEKSGKTLGYAIRKFNPDPNAPKYVLKYYSDITKMYPEFKVDEELEKDTNFLNNYFNILNLDFSKPITAVEGQIDSLFIDNCVSTSGLGKIHVLLENVFKDKNKIRILFDRDKDGKKVMMELILLGYSVFLWDSVIEDLKKRFKGNRTFFELKDVKDINDLYLFLKSKDPDTTLESFNAYISKFFSSSTYDLIHL